MFLSPEALYAAMAETLPGRSMALWLGLLLIGALLSEAFLSKVAST